MEAKLCKVVADKISERREYLALIDATKELNFDLYQKMVSAGERRTDALCVNEPSLSGIVKDQNSNNSITIKKPLNQSCQPVRNNKSARGKRSSKKGIHFSEKAENCNTNENVVNEEDQDEEEQSLHWGYSILMKEFHRRNGLRIKNKVTSKQANEKLKSFLAFKKLKEEHQKQANKKKGNGKKKKDESNLLLPESNETIKDPSNDKNETNKLVEVKELKKLNKETDEMLKKGSIKKNTEIVNVHDQIQSKKKKRVAESADTSSVNPIFKSKTEKEKIKEARKQLRELNERAERKIREKELQDQVEEDGEREDNPVVEVPKNPEQDKQGKGSDEAFTKISMKCEDTVSK